MIKERAWPAKAMYILIATALAISLIIVAAPANKVSADPGLSEWDRVSTPTMEGFVVAPDSVIIDYALADGGEVAYAVVEAYDDDPCDDEDAVGDPAPWTSYDYRLLKSDDHAATWTDITDAVEDLAEDELFDYEDPMVVDDEDYIDELVQVATDWEDPDFVAVALVWFDWDTTTYFLHVFFSTDGGGTFEDAGWVQDAGVDFDGPVSDLAVSYEAAGKRDIAIGGVMSGPDAALFRCTVTGDAASAWEDATDYAGWDDDGTLPYGPSMFVTDIIFSPNWATDKTILVTTIAPGATYYDVYLQCGSFGTSEGWNEWSTLGIEAVLIIDDVDLPMFLVGMDGRGIAGITLPEDYNGKNAGDRVLWVWVNYYDPSPPLEPMCQITRVDDDSADPVGPMGQIEDGELWLTNVSYHGTIAEGEAIAGVLGTGTYDPVSGSPDDLFAECSEGVQVYRNDGIRNMDICCERWHDACKPPTGRAAMAVSWVDDDKAYAVALQGDVDYYDEGAWSVTFDDGDTWNQLSLIDTHIDYFSDVAVSPDCNKTMLVSVNLGIPPNGNPDICQSDSVWLHAETLPEAEEYSGKWLRTWSGQLESDSGFLRLAPEETTGDTVVLVDYDTNNVYLNDLETLACWDPIGATELDEIMDLALQDADTLFALDYNGDVAMFDDDEWQEAVDSEVDNGYTIAVWGDHILVGGADGDVSYSAGGDWEDVTFDLLETIPTIDGDVTVAFDTYFDTNDVVYAATNEGDFTGGIYQWVIGESEEWQDLNALPQEWQVLPSTMWTAGTDGTDEIEVAFTGLVVDRPGNPFTDPENGGVIYASYVGYLAINATDGYYFTGAARSLERAVTVCTTCLDWDFLFEGLTAGSIGVAEDFEASPDALKICGCLTPDTNTHLFALDDGWGYDMCEGEDGALWTFEDCYAKKAPDTTTPDVEADPCSCYSAPFTLVWDTLCDACVYEIQFALDEEFTMPVKVNREGEPETDYIISGLTGDNPSYSVMGGEAGGLSCETTYHWRVRASEAATGQLIHSWWTVGESFTVPPSQMFGYSDITLLAPEPDATNVHIVDVGFSWDISASADEFSWKLMKGGAEVHRADELSGTYYEYAGPLDEGATYNWQVTAYNNGDLISVSPVGTFTTAKVIDFCCDDCDVCFDTEAELLNHFNTVHTVTPPWVWVIIGLGAALVIVVIVLIFRTRRV